MQIEEIKDQICDVCHKMWQLGWVAANDGNVSVRLEDGTFLATPTGMSKSFITPDKLLRIDAKGNVLEGAEGLRPSSEIKMHLRCYEKRADVNAVVHAHPPAATGFAVAHRPMDMYNMIEDVAAIGAVPLTPYTRDYELEQTNLTNLVEHLRQEVKEQEKQKVNVRQFIAAVRKYTDMQQLDASILREFVDKIYISEVYTPDENEPRIKVREIEIVYNFIGAFDFEEAREQSQAAQKEKKTGVA